MKQQPLDIFALFKKASGMVFSRPLFFVFGACITFPKLLFETFLNENERFASLLTSLESGASISFSSELLALPLFLLFAIITGSFGIASLILLANAIEKNSATPKAKMTANSRKTAGVLKLEITLIALTILAGVILALPATIAMARGLEGLAHALSLSALGLLLSIALLFFFLRQYAAIYVSLSNISLSAALENAYRLFRTHIKETTLISLAIFSVEIILTLSLLFTETLLGSFFKEWFLVISYGYWFIWAMSLLIFSFFEAWNWTVWTLLFRVIALPKEPEPVLQKSETVIQQESAIGLDKA